MSIKKTPRVCVNCDKVYIPHKKTQTCCSQKCWKHVYWLKTKEYALRLKNTFPKIICQKCQKVSELTFDPLTEGRKFDHHRCPYCYKVHAEIRILRKDGKIFIIF